MISELLSMLEEILKRVKRENKVLNIMGNYNSNLLDPNRHPDPFTNLMFSHGNIPLINKSTRISAAKTLNSQYIDE